MYTLVNLHIEHVLVTCTQIKTKRMTTPETLLGPLPATTPPKVTTTLSLASVWTLYKWTHTVRTPLSVKLIILLCRPVVFLFSPPCRFPLGDYAIVYLLSYCQRVLVKCSCDPGDMVTMWTQPCWEYLGVVVPGCRR